MRLNKKNKKTYGLILLLVGLGLIGYSMAEETQQNALRASTDIYKQTLCENQCHKKGYSNGENYDYPIIDYMNQCNLYYTRINWTSVFCCCTSEGGTTTTTITYDYSKHQLCDRYCLQWWSDKLDGGYCGVCHLDELSYPWDPTPWANYEPCSQDCCCILQATGPSADDICDGECRKKGYIAGYGDSQPELVMIGNTLPWPSECYCMVATTTTSTTATTSTTTTTLRDWNSMGYYDDFCLETCRGRGEIYGEDQYGYGAGDYDRLNVNVNVVVSGDGSPRSPLNTVCACGDLPDVQLPGTPIINVNEPPIVVPYQWPLDLIGYLVVFLGLLLIFL